MQRWQRSQAPRAPTRRSTQAHCHSKAAGAVNSQEADSTGQLHCWQVGHSHRLQLPDTSAGEEKSKSVSSTTRLPRKCPNCALKGQRSVGTPASYKPLPYLLVCSAGGLPVAAACFSENQEAAAMLVESVFSMLVMVFHS